MSASERRKGVRGEREVAKLLEAAGFEVRGLESGGDHLAVLGELVLHVESKRHETARPWAWHEQSAKDAPEGTLGVVFFRRNEGRWLVLADGEAFAQVLAAGRSSGE